MPLVPDDFVVPHELVTERFRLEPLGPRHNERDHAAWTRSIDHIRATPGFGSGTWPPAVGMSLDDNLADLRRHADDFANRTGFTYSVLSGDEVVGCVYIYPLREDSEDSEHGQDGEVAQVRSWVRADRADLDVPLYEAVSRWLAADWPIARVRYASR